MQDVLDRVTKNPKFHEFIAMRSRYSIIMAIVSAAIYYGFILLVAFNPGLMAMRLGGENSVITFGPVAILSMFVLFWALTRTKRQAPGFSPGSSVQAGTACCCSMY